MVVVGAGAAVVVPGVGAAVVVLLVVAVLGGVGVDVPVIGGGGDVPVDGGGVVVVVDVVVLVDVVVDVVLLLLLGGGPGKIVHIWVVESTPLLRSSTLIVAVVVCTVFTVPTMLAVSGLIASPLGRPISSNTSASPSGSLIESGMLTESPTMKV